MCIIVQLYNAQCEQHRLVESWDRPAPLRVEEWPGAVAMMTRRTNNSLQTGGLVTKMFFSSGGSVEKRDLYESLSERQDSFGDCPSIPHVCT